MCEKGKEMSFEQFKQLYPDWDFESSNLKESRLKLKKPEEEETPNQSDTPSQETPDVITSTTEGKSTSDPTTNP